MTICEINNLRDMPSPLLSTDSSAASVLDEILLSSRHSRDRPEQSAVYINVRPPEQNRNQPVMSTLRQENEKDDIDSNRDNPTVRRIIISLHTSLPLHVLRPEIATLCDELSWLRVRTQKYARLHHWLQRVCFTMMQISHDLLNLLAACSDVVRNVLSHHYFSLELLRDGLPRLAELHIETSFPPLLTLASHARRITSALQKAAFDAPTSQKVAPRTPSHPVKADNLSKSNSCSHVLAKNTTRKNSILSAEKLTTLSERQNGTYQKPINAIQSSISCKLETRRTQAPNHAFADFTDQKSNVPHPHHHSDLHVYDTVIDNGANATDVIIDVENCITLLRKLASTLRITELFWNSVNKDKQQLGTLRLITKLSNMTKCDRTIYIQSPEFRQQWTNGLTWWIAVYVLCDDAHQAVKDLHLENYRLLVGEEVDYDLRDSSFNQNFSCCHIPDLMENGMESDILPSDIDCHDHRLVSTLSEISEDDEMTNRLGRLNGHIYSSSKQKPSQKHCKAQQLSPAVVETKKERTTKLQKVRAKARSENISQFNLDRPSKEHSQDYIREVVDEHGDTWRNEKSQGT